MKNNVTVLVIVIEAFLFLCGCQQLAKHNEENIEKEDFFDIYYIKEAPKATERHNLEEVITLVLNTNINTSTDTIAINVQDGEIYINPQMSSLGVHAKNGTKKVDDINKILEILEKYEVQDWKEDYTFEDPSTYEDGTSWHLFLQYEDGTIEQHGGSGTDEEKIKPDSFDAFIKEIADFVDERINER